MKILQTKRLSLEEATIADAPFILKLLNSPGWLQFIGDTEIRTLEAAQKYIEYKLIKSYKENGFGMFKMVRQSDQAILGMCGLLNRTTLSDIDIGFAILAQYGRKGYTYEAASAILDYAQFNLKLKKVIGLTSMKNIKSQNLLLKLGLKKEGIVKWADTDEDVLSYSISFD